MINQNLLAREITEKEGLKVQVNIAQVKEVQKHLLIALAECSDAQVIRLLDRVAKRHKIERPLGLNLRK
jgi:hypothetical protein